MISVGSQFRLHKALGYVWSGWMGGQYAFTTEILSYVERKTLVVLCGGPGDLCLNALLKGAAIAAINVDASKRAIEYGNKIAKALYTEVDEELGGWVMDISKINDGDRGVPTPLTIPHIPEVMYDEPQVEIKFSNVQSDALVYLIGQDCVPDVGTTFFYLATPTVLPDGVLKGGKKHFYQLYDPDIKMGVNWADSNSEWYYIGRMIEEIARIDPKARIGFGVGEGDIPLGQYTMLFKRHGRTSVVLEKSFQGEGYEFTDWLIICDLGA